MTKYLSNDNDGAGTDAPTSEASAVGYTEPQCGGSYTRNPLTGALTQNSAPDNQPEQE